jgi:transposase
MQEPEEVPDEEHERIFERVAAIDVAKATGMVCTRVPHPSKPNRRLTRVWEVSATTTSIMELADHLLAAQVERVTIESTSDYWRGFFYLLEARGVSVALVNARDAKNVPGRPKIDKRDAVWLAKLTERGMLRPSFVPPAAIRVLRDYTRLRTDLTIERTRHWQRLEKLLEDALIKITAVASRIDGVSVREMIEALIAGQRDPRVRAGFARGRMRMKHPALIEALTGRFDDHHGELARMLLDQIDSLTTQIDRLTVRIEELVQAIPAAAAPAASGSDPDDRLSDGSASAAAQPLAAIDRLDEIPGLARRGAQVILAEIGLDMAQFPTAGHLVSWSRLCPRTVQ